MKYIFFMLLLLAACQKNNFEASFTPVAKPCQISQIEQNSYVPDRYFFDQNKRLIRSIILKEDLIRSEYQYDNTGKLVRIDDFYSDNLSAGYKSYEYNSKGALLKINHFLPDIFDPNLLKLHHYETFSYNKNNQLNRKEYWHFHGKPYMETDNYQEFDYDQNGNIKQHRVFTHLVASTSNQMVLSITGSFEYDNAQNPFPFYALPPTTLDDIGKNNIKKLTYLSPQNRLYAEGSFEAVFEYNAQNLPSKISYIFGDGSTKVKKIEYICL